MEPSIRAVRAPQAQLEFQRLAGRQRALLCSDERRQIVRMDTSLVGDCFISAMRCGRGTPERPGFECSSSPDALWIAIRAGMLSTIAWNCRSLDRSRSSACSDPRCRSSGCTTGRSRPRRHEAALRRRGTNDTGRRSVAVALRSHLRTRGEHGLPVLSQTVDVVVMNGSRPSSAARLRQLKGRCTPASAD